MDLDKQYIVFTTISKLAYDKKRKQRDEIRL